MTYTWKDIVRFTRNGQTMYCCDEFPISGKKSDNKYIINDFIKAVSEKYNIESQTIETYMMNRFDVSPVIDSLSFSPCDCGCYLNGIAEWEFPIASDNMLNNIALHEIVTKWTLGIYDELCTLLRDYYDKTDSLDPDDIAMIRLIMYDDLRRMRIRIDTINEIIDDIVSINDATLESISVILYGKDSYIVYILRFFDALYSAVNTGDRNFAWSEKKSETRLINILYNKADKQKDKKVS